jgi:hypothetical protein
MSKATAKNARLKFKIKGGNKKYKVYLCEKLYDDGQALVGHICHDTNEIFVSEESPSKDLTLVHELCHGFMEQIEDEKGMGIIHRYYATKLKHDEFFIDILAKKILQSFKLKLRKTK